MKASTKPGTPKRKAAPAAKASGLIHPIIIYPFRNPADYSHLEELYRLVSRLDADRETYARPVTVMDRKTYFSVEHDAAFQRFRKSVVAKHSDLLDAWCVDTCQMWYSGLGAAHERGGAEDVYWLIPGDFNYGTPGGREVLSRLHDLPEIIVELNQDFCIGEIATDHAHSKHLIDTYGTLALLYTWFPKEAQEIRQFTERPRSEFFAIRHGFLGEVLRQRWFAYEQTMVTLLHAVFGDRRISRFQVGQISDLPSDGESFAAASQQVERTERVLKNLWRERNGKEDDWANRFRALEAESDQVRRAALTVLQNLLG